MIIHHHHPQVGSGFDSRIAVQSYLRPHLPKEDTKAFDMSTYLPPSAEYSTHMAPVAAMVAEVQWPKPCALWNPSYGWPQPCTLILVFGE